LIKCSGGKAAQLLALSNAIYLSKKLGLAFRLVYFPYSTGTYWEWGLDELLYESEEVETRVSPGIRVREEVKHGAHIPNFPTRRSGLNYLKGFQSLNRLGLIKWLRIARREIAIGGSRKRLDQVTRRTRISGNFVPIVDEEVFEELEERLGEKAVVNPFSPVIARNSAVIHYRLGDMRIDPYGGEKSIESRVVDPKVFRDILGSLEFDFNHNSVQVVSDEPDLACRLLADVGIMANASSGNFAFWADLAQISSAKILIGSLSQMSFLGGALCVRNGGKVFLPKDVFGELDLADNFGIDSFNYYGISYLKLDHWLFR
jgi:hypothetical protein